MSGIRDHLAERALIVDGAMGTMLHAAGNSLDRALPELNLSNRELVGTIHDSYVSAGVDIVLTNTFGANRGRLDSSGLADQVRQINLAGAAIARAAADRARRPVWVGGSISPATRITQRRGLADADRADSIREQVLALAEGGVDLLVFETFAFLDELLEAVAIAHAHTDLPVIAQATFSADGLMLGGDSPRVLVERLGAYPVLAVGANCTVGPQRMLAIVSELHKHASTPIIAQPNAGMPHRGPGRRYEYDVDGEYFARYASRYVAGGASIVGGCCGTTPDHIRAAAAAARAVTERRRSVPSAASARSAGAADGSAATPPHEVTLAARLGRNEFPVICQVRSGAFVDVEAAADFVGAVRAKGVDLFFVADQPYARARADTMSVASNLRFRFGVETIATATSWDKTIMTLQAAMLGAHALGLSTVVCETGYPPLHGDYPNADGVWGVDSIGMIELLAGLNAGRDFSGISLGTKTSFHIGARFSPGAVDTDAEIVRTRAKIEAGAQFLVSRPAYELGGLRAIMAGLEGVEVPILVTLMPLRTYEETEFLAHEVPDVHIPAAVLQAMKDRANDPVLTGRAMAAELIREARAVAGGIVLGVRESEPDELDHLLKSL
jgi:methionine synthase / methylenetetrahydrofolate reductase(NADPH)